MKKMSKGLMMTALICGTMNMTAYAQTAEPQEFVLDEYVVTAARTETKLVDTPANVTVVDASKIEEGRYTDVSEVLKDVPGAIVTDDGTGATTKSVMLNGDDRVLIMVDGRRMNYDMGTFNGNAGFDMNMLPDVSLIERIEVVKGHGGALYGSDAVGGVINIITKKADHAYGKVSAGFGSNQTRDMKAMYSFKENKTGVTVAASKYKQGYYKYKDVADDATKRWPGNSKFETEKISLKVAQELTADSNLEIGYDHSKMEGTSLSSINNIYGYTITDKDTDNFYAKYDWVLNNQDVGYIQVYHNDLDYKAITNPVSHYKEKTVGIDAQQAITTSDTNKIVIGSSWRKSDVENKGVYDESVDNLAVFVNDQWEFAPTWTLNAGARLDHHNEFGSETTMSAGINKKLDDNSHVYVNWGQVFRAPTTDDLYTNMKDSYTDNDGNVHNTETLGNPNLKPEKGDTWTIGYGATINEKTNVNVSYFQSDVEDAINWDSTSKPDVIFAKNIAEQKKRGVELSVSHELNDNLDVEASYTYVRVKNDNKDGSGFVRDINAVPNTYRLGIRYHDVKWNADLFLRAGSGADTRMTGEYQGDKYYAYKDSSFVTVDMAVSYKANDAVTIFAKGYNLLNEAYAEHGGAINSSYKYPAQARRFIAGVEYSF